MKAIVDGIATEYQDEGHGPVLLLLHGWANTLHSFDSLTPSLAKKNRVVRLDLPGFGGTEAPPSAWSVQDYARFVRNFCEKIHIETDTMIGHSVGGRIILKGTAENIFSPRKIILIAAAGVAERDTVRNRVYKLFAKIGKAVLWPFPKSLYERARRLLYTYTGGDYLTVGAMSGTFIKVISEDLSENASRITVPTLLIWGNNDVVTPLVEGKKLNALIQNSSLEVIAHAGHFVHQEKSAEVADLIQTFIL